MIRLDPQLFYHTDESEPLLQQFARAVGLPYKTNQFGGLSFANGHVNVSQFGDQLVVGQTSTMRKAKYSTVQRAVAAVKKLVPAYEREIELIKKAEADLDNSPVWGPRRAAGRAADAELAPIRKELEEIERKNSSSFDWRSRTASVRVRLTEAFLTKDVAAAKKALQELKRL